MLLADWNGKELGDKFRQESAERGIAYLTENPQENWWYGICGKVLMLVKREGDTFAVYDGSVERFARVPIPEPAPKSEEGPIWFREGD